MKGVSFFPVVVQPRTKVKLDFSWPVVWIVMLLSPYKSLALLMGMSKVSETSSMLMCCSCWIYVSLSDQGQTVWKRLSFQCGQLAILGVGCSLPHRKTFSFHEPEAPGGVRFKILNLHHLWHLESFQTKLECGNSSLFQDRIFELILKAQASRQYCHGRLSLTSWLGVGCLSAFSNPVQAFHLLQTFAGQPCFSRHLEAWVGLMSRDRKS